jgi:hypothetical protein
VSRTSDSPCVRARRRETARGRACATLSLVGALPILLCALFATTAHAGTYDVIADCTGPAGVNHAFVASSTDTTSFTTTTTCPTGDGQDAGIHVGEVLHSPNAFIAGGAHAGYTVTAPTGTTITGISYRRYLGQFGDRDTIPGLRDASGTLVGSEWCQYPSTDFSCSRGSPFISIPPVDVAGLSTSSLTFGLVCVPEPPATACLSSASDEQAWFSVYSADVTITETTAPALGLVSGSLLAGGWLRGAQMLTLASASDPSGVQSAALSIDGGALSSPSSNAPTACDFTFPKPCGDSAGTAWTLDTTSLPDGQHTATIAATNAAGVSASSTPVSFETDNTAPGAPLALASSVGAGWQGASSTQLSWTLPDQGQGSPIASAMVQLCDSQGQNCALATQASSLTGATITAPAPGAYQANVWLLDTAGNVNPASAATIPFRYATAPPPAPSGISSSAMSWQPSPHVAVTWTPAARGANDPPIAFGEAQVCNLDGSGCGAPLTVGPSGGTVELPHEGAFQLRGWLIDAAGHSSSANAAITEARYSSSPPVTVIVHRIPSGPTSSRRFDVSFRSTPVGPAPLAGTRWTLCQGTSCPLSGTTTATELSGVVPRPGGWTLSLTPIDLAGVTGATTATVFAITHSRSLPGLRLKLALRSHRIVVRLRASKRFSGTVRVRVTLRGPRLARAITRSVRVRHGAARLVISVSATVRRGSVVARFDGSAAFRAQRVTISHGRTS